MVKAAIIGAGFAGDVHAEALHACGVCVEVVVCLSVEEARVFAEKWGIPKWGDDIALALQEEIDVVHICTPPTTHGELIGNDVVDMLGADGQADGVGLDALVQQLLGGELGVSGGGRVGDLLCGESALLLLACRDSAQKSL